MDSSAIGRVVLVAGVIIAACGAWMALGNRLPFGSLPGDISGSSGNVSWSFSIVTCIVVSVVLTLIINFVIRH